MYHLVRFTRRQCVFALLTASILFNLPVAAQESSGRVIGVISDPSGAVIPHAKVTVTNVDTNVSQNTTTGPDGSYQVLLLPVGNYRVTAEAEGFRKAVTSAQKLEINQSLKIDVKLEVGTTTETVQVEANASGVETVVSTLGSVVAGTQIAEAPLDGRNVMDLATLLPGVVPTPMGGGATGTAGGSAFNIAGGRNDSVTFVLDGGMNNDLLDNGLMANPNPDAIEEFRILTSNYNAEYGRNGSGIVSVVTKSGTNDYHGVLFEYIRNNDFNANSFFNNENGLPVNILKRNQFGAEVGGPLSIPKLYNAKNKLFFMTAWQSQRLTQVQANPQITVFTPQELAGNFSQAGPNGGPDPKVVSFLQQNSYFQPNPSLAAQGIIDPTKISPVAQAYIKAGLIPSTPNGQLIQAGNGTNNNDELTNKIDWVVTEKDRVSVTLYAQRASSLNLDNPLANGASTYYTNGGDRYLGTLAYTKTISPNMVNDFRFTAQRNNVRQAFPASSLPTPSQLGSAVTPDQATGPTRLSFFDQGWNVGFSPQGPTNEIDNTYIWNDTFSWQRGNHGFKMGFSYTPFQNNTIYDFYVDGEFDFFGASGGGSYSQNDFADFLMGLPDDLFQGPKALSNIRTHNLAGYFQDEWKVKKNLTLTLGMRYEFSSPKLDTQGRTFTLGIDQQSTVFPNAPPGLLFPGDPGSPRGVNFPDYNNWAPRFGFAWDPKGNGKMSIRGGFGMFYDILKGEDNLQFNGAPPFYSESTLFFNPFSGNSAPLNMSDPFGALGLPDAFPSKPPNHDLNFAAAGLLPTGGDGIFMVNPHLKTPYVYQYNFSVQREVWKDTTLEVAYIGSDSHELTSLKDANPFPIGGNTRLFNLQPDVQAYAAANGVNFPVFSFIPEFNNAASAYYNALTVGLNKRYSDTRFGSFLYQFSYTYGHSIDNASGFRATNSQVPAWDWDRFRADSDFDIRHYISFSGSWELPFYHMFQNAPRRLTKGWTLYPIVTYRTGTPMTIFSGLSTRPTDPGPSGAGDQGLILANQVAPVPYFNPENMQTFTNPTAGVSASGNYWFNPAAFNADFSGFGPSTGVYTYGTSGRNAYRGPDLINVDLSLAKTTFLYQERVKLEIRADFFNIFNHAEFQNPNTTIGSPQFGQILATGVGTDPRTRIIQLAARFSF